MNFNDVDFNDVLRALQPSTGNPVVLVIEILLYILFFLNLIAFFLQSDKQLLATLLVGLTMVLTLLGKLSTTSSPIIRPKDLAMLIINVGIFVVPLSVFAMSKDKRSKPLMMIAGVLGGVYFFMYWFFLQRN